MRRALFALGAGGLGLAGLLVVRALLLTPSSEGPPASAPARAVDGALQRLAEGLRHRTVSPQDPGERDAAAFLGFHRYLESAFPRVHEQLEREVVAGLSLLYHWKGTEPDLDPLVLLAHQDVVPVEPGTEASWEEPPFAGVVRDGFLWGRGALDDKLSLFATLEAVEWLLAQGHQPRRPVLLAFGHDEELGGSEGAAGIAERLRAGGIRPFLVLDEGGSVARGIVPLLERDVAVIGVAEKGYVSVELTVETEGGHSSTPRGESSIGILARAVSRLEGSPPAPRLDDSMRAFFAHLAPEAPFAARLVLANLWLFEPVLVHVLAGIPETAPAVRTTTAPTLLRAGLKDNVLPSRATAVVNFRILPGESIESVLAHVARAVDDARVVLAPLPKRREPSLASRLDSEAYALLARTIREVFPDVVVAPYLMVAGTDSRHFRPLTENVYRFLPARLDGAAVAGIHGTNERVAPGALDTAVAFYVRLIRNTAG